MFPRSTHETFAEKLYQTFKDHKRFTKPKLARNDFTICHYAGDVTYQTEQFLDKNKDYVVAEHQALLSESKCSFISGLFPPLPEESSKSSKFSSIGTQFKQQLQALLETLSATEPHYIRCVKPNNALKPSIFENMNILQQLRCGGVMEAIRISCAGYPSRKVFDEFLDRFGILAPDVLGGSYDSVAACKKLLEKVNLKGYQIGKTKVFLRAGQMAELDAFRNEVLGRSATVIQRKIRMYYCRKSFVMLQQSAIDIQRMSRGNIARNLYQCLKREAACLKIQKQSRCFLARKAYINMCNSAVSVQTGIRSMLARTKLCFLKQTRAVTHIQSHCRRHLDRCKYLRMKKAAIITQSAWRRRLAHRELRNLKMAAKETGALQAAKSKLEKEVEELTWHLQLEKQMRADLEEAKTQENAKLQSALTELQLELQETKALLTKELKSAKRAGEQVSILQEVPTADHELVNKLTAENEMLKATVSSLEKKIDEAERKFEEANNLSEERLKQALDAEIKIIELKTTMQRLEEKISDMEVEDQVLRQQVLHNSPVREHLAITSQVEENGHHEPFSSSPAKRFATESFKRSQIERLHESVGTLLQCAEQNLGFSHGKPVAAFTIYKCLSHWRLFETERTSIFDRLIQMIGLAIENQENNDHMAYWLSNTSSLLFLLQRTLKGSGTSPKLPPSTSFFGRMAQSFRSSSSSANLGVGKDVVRPVETKYPALLFKQQLTAYVEKIAGIIRDNLKKELLPLLSMCIQAPKSSKGTALESSGQSFDDNSQSTNHWHSIVESLDEMLNTLQDNFVSSVLVQKIFSQVFTYINVQLFNSLLLHRECCTFSNGEYVKVGLDELELWCGRATTEYAGSSWDELKHTRQAVGFLVIHQKLRISYDDIANDLCPVLSIQQQYRICTLYCDDNYNTSGVSPDVITSMKAVMTDDSNDEDSNSFLLDDDSSIPFSVEDISGSLHVRDFMDVKPAAELLEKSAFQFLLD